MVFCSYDTCVLIFDYPLYTSTSMEENRTIAGQWGRAIWLLQTLRSMMYDDPFYWMNYRVVWSLFCVTSCVAMKHVVFASWNTGWHLTPPVIQAKSTCYVSLKYGLSWDRVSMQYGLKLICCLSPKYGLTDIDMLCCPNIDVDSKRLNQHAWKWKYQLSRFV